MIMQLIGLFISILLASIALLWVVKLVTIKCGCVSKPRKDRWNTRVVSLHGGVGFFPIIAIGFLYLIFQNYDESSKVLVSIFKNMGVLSVLISILLGSFILFILGLLDDIYNCKPVVKIITQLIVSGIFIYSGGGFSVFEVDAFNIIITCLWLVVVINAVNLMDNMDGLSSGVAIISIMFLIMTFFLNSHEVIPLSIYIGTIFLGSLFAFLFFNWFPSTIFMGDSGSLSIGFILATLIIPGSINNYLGILQDGSMLSMIVSFLVPILLILAFLFDTTFVSITRILSNKSILKGGRDHISHRLVISGITEKKSALLIYLFSLISGVCALLLLMAGDILSVIFVVLPIFFLMIFSGRYLSKVDPY